MNLCQKVPPQIMEEMGELNDDADPVHFVGGPLCGLTAATRTKDRLFVRAENVRGRWHVYQRVPYIDSTGQYVLHAEIRDGVEE